MGFYLGKGKVQPKPSEPAAPETETQSASSGALPSAGSANGSAAAAAPSARKAGVGDPFEMTDDEVAKVESAIDALKPTAAEARLGQVLGGDPLGKKIWRAVMAGNHADEIEGADDLGEKYLEDFKKEPDKAFNMMSKAIAEMPDNDFPVEKASLLVAASELPGQEAKVQQLALKELTEAIAPPRPDPADAKAPEDLDQALSSGPSMLLPVAAHAALMRTTSDANTALSETIQGIMAQPDPEVRNTLAGQFVEKFPDHEQELKSNLSSRGVELRPARPLPTTDENDS